MYPNNSLKASVHFLELGQFVCNSSLNFFLDIDFHYRNQMGFFFFKMNINFLLFEKYIYQK
jgi:hypothetical protein